jgi:hypothetical protein
MPCATNLLVAAILISAASANLYAQGKIDSNTRSEKPSQIILFRTFDIFNFARSYRVYMSDSLVGRIKTKGVIIVESFGQGVTLHASTKAPSLNAEHKANYQKRKKIRYPITLTPGRVYFVKCGYLNQNVFDLPRQPTVRLLRSEEVRKYLKKRFLKREISDYLYEKWLNEKDLKKLATKN